MQRVREYLHHAETCRTVAAKARDPSRREELLDLAVKWTFLAGERERLLKSRERLEQLSTAGAKSIREAAT